MSSPRQAASSKTLTVLVQSGAGSIPPGGRADQFRFGVGQSERRLDEHRVDQQPHRDSRPASSARATPRSSSVRVRFDLNGDPNNIGGSFSTGTSVIYSDANGDAITAYIPGTEIQPDQRRDDPCLLRHRRFRCTACPNSAVATITVVSDPLSVTIGSN